MFQFNVIVIKWNVTKLLACVYTLVLVIKNFGTGVTIIFTVSFQPQIFGQECNFVL